MYSPKVLLAFVAVIVGVSAYPTGAPTDVCVSMEPGHGAQPQNGRFPYEILIKKPNLKAGWSTSITIRGMDGHEFRGFMMQARAEGSTKPIGTFTIPDNNSHTIDCGAGKANTVTQSNGKDKKEVTVTWVAPDNFKGNVVFYVTIVKVFDTYWVAHPSSPVKIS